MKDRRTMVAVNKRWQDAELDTGVSTLFQNVPDPRPTSLYTVMKCEPDRASAISFRSEIDYRRVTFTIWGIGQDVVNGAMDEINTSFSDDYPGVDLIYGTTPTDPVWIRTERMLSGGDKAEIAEFTQQGQWWKGTLVYVVWATWNF